MKVYKIRNKETGLFSTGGLHPTWSKTGKVWQRIGHVHLHINQLVNEKTIPGAYKNAEIVEAEITEILTHVEDAKDWLIKSINADIERFEGYSNRTAYWDDHINSLKHRRDNLQ